MFANESDAGALGEIAFQDRSGIHVPDAVDELGKLLELLAHHVMVVARAGGVPGDVAGLARVVIHPDDNDRTRAGKHLFRRYPLAGIALHIAHFAMKSVGQPLLELPGMRRRRGGGDANEIETQRAGARLDVSRRCAACRCG